jgi:hypothetical protein
MLGSLVLTFQNEKTRYWEARYLQFRKKKLDAGKLGIGSSERKSLMLGSLVLALQKRKTRCWEACHSQIRKKKLDSGRLGTGSSETEKT